MLEFSEFEIIKLLEDDVPFLDLTTSLQNINSNAKLSIITREQICLSCIDVCIKLAKILDINVIDHKNNQEIANPNDILIEFSSSYEKIHKIWKCAQILLEYSCGISTYTNQMVKNAQSVNSKCQILTTRKTFPFSKKLCLKAVIEGGGHIHRANISDSILFFDNHLIAYNDFDEFLSKIPEFKAKIPEKKIIVECNEIEKIQKLLLHNIDGIQCDKCDIDTLKEIVNLKNSINKNTIILACGGINKENVKEFASTGIDAIVTSAPYTAKMANLTSKIKLI